MSAEETYVIYIRRSEISSSSAHFAHFSTNKQSNYQSPKATNGITQQTIIYEQRHYCLGPLLLSFPALALAFCFEQAGAEYDVSPGYCGQLRRWSPALLPRQSTRTQTVHTIMAHADPGKVDQFLRVIIYKYVFAYDLPARAYPTQWFLLPFGKAFIGFLFCFVKNLKGKF